MQKALRPGRAASYQALTGSFPDETYFRAWLLAQSNAACNCLSGVDSCRGEEATVPVCERAAAQNMRIEKAIQKEIRRRLDARGKEPSRAGPDQDSIGDSTEV
jgi:hypothetical protein